MKNINYNKGFVVQGMVALVALLLISGGAYYVGKNKVIAPKNNQDVIGNVQSDDLVPVQSDSNTVKTSSTENNQIVKVDIADWKTYYISDLGIEFKYPSYFGDVIIKKTDRTSCPQMKTYQSPELLPSKDYVVSFSNNPKVGTGGSYIEARILIARTENNTNYCGLDIAKLGNIMSSKSNYQKLNSGRANIREEYVSDLFTSLGTSVDQFYSLFFVKRNEMILVQPIITFIPYSGSDEMKEIEKNTNIIDFVKTDKIAEQVRGYLRDFEALAASVKFTN